MTVRVPKKHGKKTRFHYYIKSIKSKLLKAGFSKTILITLPVVLFMIFIALSISLIRLQRVRYKRVVQEQNQVPYPTFTIKQPIPTAKASPTPNLTPFPEILENPVESKVAYINDGEIWTINADRTNQAQITNDEYTKFGISISPDSSKIAYSFYPDDPEKRTNEGYYVGYNSGLAYVNIETKQVVELVEYGDVQNHYATWSPDNQYLATWTGNGISSSLYDTSSDQPILTLSLKASTEPLADGLTYYPKPDDSISPIVWIPNKNKISFIQNGDLIFSDPNGENKSVIISGVDALRQVHEGPNVPQPPNWSPSGRFLTYYKNASLYLMDVINDTEVLIGTGTESEIFETLMNPSTYVIGFDKKEEMLVLLDYSQEKTTVLLDIASGRKYPIASFGQTAVLSPDKLKVLGLVGNIHILDLDTQEENSCNTSLDYDYYWWVGGLTYTPNLTVWSPNSNAIIGRDGVNILNLENCERYQLVKGKIRNPVWFPN